MLMESLSQGQIAGLIGFGTLVSGVDALFIRYTGRLFCAMLSFENLMVDRLAFLPAPVLYYTKRAI